MAELIFDTCLNYLVLALSIFMLLSESPSPANAASVQYNVVSLGARADGQTDSTKAFQSAWALAYGSTRAATIYVPWGRSLVQSASFNGPCKNSAITVCIDSTLVAPFDYNVNGNAANWIVFRHVTRVSVIGGTLDGQGMGLWACKLSGKSCPSGATNLLISNSQNILVSRLSSLNSQMFHIIINGYRNVKMQGLKVLASWTSPNADSIHVAASTGVTILDSKIGTGLSPLAPAATISRLKISRYD